MNSVTVVERFGYTEGQVLVVKYEFNWEGIQFSHVDMTIRKHRGGKPPLKLDDEVGVGLERIPKDITDEAVEKAGEMAKDLQEEVNNE